MYDNTKFYAAFEEWLKQNVEVGFGEEYAGDLLDDFEDFLRDTKMMKTHPGRVQFGKRLGLNGEFGKKKRAGLTYWTGLTLKMPRKSIPKRYKSTVKLEQQEELDRKIIRDREAMRSSPEARSERLQRFHAELEEEERKLRRAEDEPIENL